MRFPSSTYGQMGLNALFGRGDVCDEAFPGEGASTEHCSPSSTLCCVRKGRQYPACQSSMGKGWCCIGTGKSNCYVDIPSSCGDPNAVPCTNLEEGVTKACCPRLTSCHDGYKASELIVRCNIQYDDLAALETATISESGKVTSSSSSSPSSSSTSLPGTSAPSSSTSPPPPADSGPTISIGAIAGICVSATLAFVLLAVLIWIILRRRKKALAEKKEKAAAQGQAEGGNQGYQAGGGGGVRDGQFENLNHHTGSSRNFVVSNPPSYLSELPSDPHHAEAPGDTRRYSYYVGQDGVKYYGPMELMTERVVPVEMAGDDAQTGHGVVPGHHH